MRCVRRIAVIAALTGSAGTLSAQQAPAVLTLDEALRIARSGNPEFLRTANDLEVAGSSVRSAWGAFLPSLNTSLSFSGSRSTTLTGEDFFGDPIESPEPVTSRRSSASQGISTGERRRQPMAQLSSVSMKSDSPGTRCRQANCSRRANSELLLTGTGGACSTPTRGCISMSSTMRTSALPASA